MKTYLKGRVGPTHSQYERCDLSLSPPLFGALPPLPRPPPTPITPPAAPSPPSPSGYPTGSANSPALTAGNSISDPRQRGDHTATVNSLDSQSSRHPFGPRGPPFLTPLKNPVPTKLQLNFPCFQQLRPPPSPIAWIRPYMLLVRLELNDDSLLHPRRHRQPPNRENQNPSPAKFLPSH